MSIRSVRVWLVRRGARNDRPCVDARSARRPPSAAPSKPYSAPRTPWGDPDLQGNYTNIYENGTPLERPDQFAGRNLEDIKGEELRAIKDAIRKRTVEAFNGPIHAPDNWWQPALALDKGSQAWLVVEPEDGRIPPLTPEAQQRIAARRRRAEVERPRRGRLVDRPQPLRPLHHPRPPGSMMPAIYGNSYQIVQGPGVVAIVYEMIHETRVIPHPGRRRTWLGPSTSTWATPAAAGKATRWSSRRATSRTAASTATPTRRRSVLTERFTRIGPEQVRWRVTVDDPQTWTRPWSFQMPLTLNDSEPLQQYECHEGNYGLKNILSAARAEERAAARGARRACRR